MESSARLGFIRITPRKVGLIVDEVRGKTVDEALRKLDFFPAKRTSGLIAKAIRSAVSNAVVKGYNGAQPLMIKEILVGKGTTLKRFRAKAKGSAGRILKYTSHLSVKVGT